MNKTLKSLFGFFIKGLIIILPVYISIRLVVWGISSMDSVFNIGIPGVGILIVLVTITILGYFVTIFVTEPIEAMFDKWLDKLPVFKLLYTSIRDLMEAFVGEEKKFNEAVIVKVNDDGLSRMGFITQKDLSFMGEEELVAVYFPHSYAVSGEFYLVPRKRVRKLDISATEAMKFVVSGGISDLENAMSPKN
jgi:uncharacterized membrane protein